MSGSEERAQLALDKMKESVVQIKQFKVDNNIKDRLDMIQLHLDAIRNGLENSQVGFFLPSHVNDIQNILPDLEVLLLRRVKENQKQLRSR